MKAILMILEVAAPMARLPRDGFAGDEDLPRDWFVGDEDRPLAVMHRQCYDLNFEPCRG